MIGEIINYDQEMIYLQNRFNPRKDYFFFYN